MMDCDTTGVEPDIALVKYKKLVGGGMMKIVNQTVPMALRKLGYTPQQVDAIVDYINVQETIEGAPGLKESHLPVFDCAFKAAKGQRSIHYMGHIKMMGATQPFISGAISKTVNVPKEATVEEITQAYIQSWKLGAKAISIYRDGSKRTQPLNTSRDKTAAEIAQQAAASMVTGPIRRKLPDERHAITHKFDIAGPRGLHHRRAVRGRPAGRDLPRDGEGRLDDLRVRRCVRAGDLLRAAVRRAAPGAGGQVQPRPVRAVGHDEATRRSASRSRSSTTSSGGWRASSCRTRRSSTPASTAASSKSTRTPSAEQLPDCARAPAAGRGEGRLLLDDSEPGRRPAVLDVRRRS